MSKKNNEENYRDLESLPKHDVKLMRSFMKGIRDLLTLWIINEKKQHGYELMTRINTFYHLSCSKKKLAGPSTMYPLLHKLEKNGLIKGTWESQGKKRVKYYEITPEGKSKLSTVKKVIRSHMSEGLKKFLLDMFFENEKET